MGGPGEENCGGSFEIDGVATNLFHLSSDLSKLCCLLSYPVLRFLDPSFMALKELM